MIFESWPWRRDLIRDVDILRRWKDKPASGRRGFIIEKKVFASAFAMRKLIESLKLSTDRPAHEVTYSIYPSIRPITAWGQGELDRYYDLENPEGANISVRDLVNLIIHSFIFMEDLDLDNRPVGFFVNSDRTRSEAVWNIPIEDYLLLMIQIANDSPSKIEMRYNQVKGDWVVWRGSGSHSEIGGKN